ncbi:TetR/AcrR family transcriptional regulator [Phytomonospora endophytica]|uniref:AcrR family transcriptional regulator n=1 Tax=Phytomonospora endophytica TaxID=714109 RepID=A0A841FUN5_9ACTN|nr:TetR/AcrR family transcriptional regulator [Phytomonospora endophytica]MBB6037262.1 AcrR family transcriptional regulator [Phytomonospora endophytica]GIG71237.1 TetR family transcriptional regulator [Phytomonospora endophytica]
MTPSAPAPTRGRIDKRRAILDAAITVFARDGYAQASVDAIAAEARVAKPTIYNHLGGKENLFRTAMVEAAEESRRKVLATLEGFPTDPAGPEALRTDLNAIAWQLVDCMRSAAGWAMSRLLYAEAARFPDVYDAVQAEGGRQVNDALAGRLARLANAGHLEIPDPLRAARHFMALISADIPGLSALGTRAVADKVLRESIADGVDTFLRAFAKA